MEKLQVLVVDDEPGICSGITRILSRYSVGFPFMDEDIAFEVLETHTGEEAIGIIEKKVPDIILLDNKLPGIQGIEVLEHINKKNLDTIVLMITSYASLELAVKATNQGAHDFIPKPFTPQELKSAIESVTKHIFLKRMTRKLNKEGRQIRFQFLSVLSHELKAPLNAIEGYLRIMEDRQAGNDLDAYNKIIERSLVRVKGMRSLIMDLLDLTRIESGKKKREVVPVNMTEVARLSIDTMGPISIQKDVKIDLDAPGEVFMEADREEMEIIFNNLLSNAIKYNIEGGTVDCKIEQQDQSILITVSDTGIGITEEEIPRLFQEFVRIRNEKTRQIAGSGLGLSIVKKLIRLYKGEIKVSSKPGEGSTFTVIFPLKTPANNNIQEKDETTG
ncbi:MAG: hybrid sensor histidine kinase/response regulator [Marinilabiliales bacterium]|nr:MAG: hybrid sensor histidine kinase/response regulator [Marinilabiliales bacterium]